MLDTLIQSKTRLKLLLRFFLNPESSAYLRGLASEFEESTNSVRVELNRFEEAGLIRERDEQTSNKKIYEVNREHPLFNDFHHIALKHFGIDHLVEQVVKKLGNVDQVWLTGDMARGLDTPIIDIAFIGKEIDRSYLAELTEKTEKLLEKKIRTVVFKEVDEESVPKPRLLIFGE